MKNRLVQLAFRLGRGVSRTPLPAMTKSLHTYLSGDRLGIGVAMEVLVQYREVALVISALTLALFAPFSLVRPDVVPTICVLLLGSAIWSIFLRVEASTEAKIAALVVPHQRELSIKRQQLYRKGSYGLVEDKAWRKEVDRFLDRIVDPQVSLKSESRRQWARTLVDHIATTAPVAEGFSLLMSPVEYEHLIARTLRQFGWTANTTELTGDQGVDVRAHKGTVKLVIQCKLYTGTVGNAAVQEAISAREWEGATHAAVVSNAGYTKAAKELAHKAGIFLWHHDDLPHAERDCMALPPRSFR